MGKLIIHDATKSREEIIAERHARFNAKSPQEKIEQLFSLITIAEGLNNNMPLKKPQGKGIIISKKK